MIYLTVFALSFFAIFMKGFAQQNMIHKRKALMIPTSWLLAAGEMFTAGIFVDNYISGTLLDSLKMVFFIGLGGGLGCMLSINFHSWLTKRLYGWDKK